MSFSTYRRLLCIGLLTIAAAAPMSAMAQARQEARLLIATDVLKELGGQRDQAIPDRLMQRAYAVAVIPDVTKVAFVVGGRHGSGVLSVRDSRGRFSNPIFVNLTGGSFGWQIGAQETDIVLVFTTRRSVEGITDGKITLGAGASVAAGPIGRQAEAAAGVNAEVYAYSRARGLFAGVALDGTALTIDDKANRKFYAKKDALPSQIISGTITRSSQNSARFLAALADRTGDASITPGNPGTIAPTSSMPSGPPPPSSTEVKTFPMEDPAPGKEPAVR
jgi:lipid-binding SYLF domain-containing protein